jgi:N-acetylmuramoyl-L-alanine amidase
MFHKTFVLLCSLIVTAGLFSFSPVDPQPQTPKKKAVRTIIIDAGHGGKDPGAKGLQSTEAQICLQTSMLLGQEIERQIPGVKILYTRTTDVLPGNMPTKDEALRYRADFANQSAADLFISIHANSAGKAPGGWNERRVAGYTEKVTYKKVKGKKKKVVTKVPYYETHYVVNKTAGTETYIWTAKENSHKGEMVSGHEASSEEDSSITIPDDDPAINALKLIYTKKYFLKSLRFADLVQQEFARSGRINRGVKQRNEKGIWVLHATGMPSVLIELGFISNKEEEEYMLSGSGQNEMVANITSALKTYLQEFGPTPAQPAGNTEAPSKEGTGLTGFLQAIEQKEKNRGGK